MTAPHVPAPLPPLRHAAAEAICSAAWRVLPGYALASVLLGDAGARQLLNTLTGVFNMIDYRNIITTDPQMLGGKPCVRGMRIGVHDVLDYLASGMTPEEILADFPYLTREDIQACLAYAADRERRLLAIPA